jgi:hypothetical protein
MAPGRGESRETLDGLEQIDELKKRLVICSRTLFVGDHGRSIDWGHGRGCSG